MKSARELQINFEIECLKDDAENTRLKNAGMRIVEGGGHGQLQLILASQTRVTNNIPSTIQLHHTNRLPPRTSTILPTPSLHTVTGIGGQAQISLPLSLHARDYSRQSLLGIACTQFSTCWKVLLYVLFYHLVG